MAIAIGTCSQSTASKVLLVVSRKICQIIGSRWSFPIPYLQSPISKSRRRSPADRWRARRRRWRSRASPSWSSGRTTRSDGMAVVLTIAASAEAAASKTCWALHHGGKATATTSAPGRTCNDNAAIATQLATSNAAALSQAGHREVGMRVSPLHRATVSARQLNLRVNVGLMIGLIELADANRRDMLPRLRGPMTDVGWSAIVTPPAPAAR